MSAREEILALEEQLRQAELGPDPIFFERRLADDAVLDGQLAKSKVVAAPRARPRGGRDLQRGIRSESSDAHPQVHARLAEKGRRMADHRGLCMAPAVMPSARHSAAE
jgi:hypothetical protein